MITIITSLSMPYCHNMNESGNIVTIYLQCCYHSNRNVTVRCLSLDNMVTIQSAHVYGGLRLTIYVNRIVQHIVRDFGHNVTIYLALFTICFTFMVKHSPPYTCRYCIVTILPSDKHHAVTI